VHSCSDGAIVPHLSIAAALGTLGSSAPLASAKPRGRGWERIAVEVDVPPETVSVVVGAGAEGTGRAWFDGLAFEVIGEARPPDAPTP
jgi:hypothetical protein